MSLLLAVVAAAAAASAPAPQTAHSVQLDHRGSTYRVDYRTHVKTSTRAIGIAPGTRTSSQRCVITANVAVERVIAGGQEGHALASMIPGTESFTRQLPGDCTGRQDQATALLDEKSQAIATHVARLAAADRQDALAAIDSAHHFAAN